MAFHGNIGGEPKNAFITLVESNADTVLYRLVVFERKKDGLGVAHERS